MYYCRQCDGVMYDGVCRYCSSPEVDRVSDDNSYRRDYYEGSIMSGDTVRGVTEIRRGSDDWSCEGVDHGGFEDGRDRVQNWLRKDDLVSGNCVIL